MTTLTRAQVRELDRRAIEEYGVPGIVLMENAGRGAAEVLMHLNPDRKPVIVYCGKGNNGGDGFVIARHLDNHRYPVVVNLVVDPLSLSGDAAINRDIASRSGLLAPTDRRALAERPSWIVDALIGTGLSGPVGEPFKRIIEGINRRGADGAHILAVDIPSGLDCDTGEPLGPTVRATHTVTFVAPKTGFTNPRAREWLGEVHIVDIGAPRVLLEQYGLK